MLQGCMPGFPQFSKLLLGFPLLSLQSEKLCSAIPYLTLVIRVWLWAASLWLTCKTQNDSWCNQPVAASWVYLLYIIIIYSLLCCILQKGNLGMETRKELCWAITGETWVPSPTWAWTWRLMETVWWDMVLLCSRGPLLWDRNLTLQWCCQNTALILWFYLGAEWKTAFLMSQARGKPRATDRNLHPSTWIWGW